jgi:hypothetical protein
MTYRNYHGKIIEQRTMTDYADDRKVLAGRDGSSPSLIRFSRSREIVPSLGLVMVEQLFAEKRVTEESKKLRFDHFLGTR